MLTAAVGLRVSLALALIARRFAVLSEPMRLRLLHALIGGEMHVNALVEATGGTQANVSRHLQTLAEAGITMTLQTQENVTMLQNGRKVVGAEPSYNILYQNAASLKADQIKLPLTKEQRRKQVTTALDLVGLSDRMDHRPGQLSGGQQQRVGIARAMVTDPTLIVADEPTGDLDTRSAAEVLTLMEILRSQLNKTIIMVTHEPKAAARAQRILHLEKGQLVRDTAAVAAH